MRGSKPNPTKSLVTQNYPLQNGLQVNRVAFFPKRVVPQEMPAMPRRMPMNTGAIHEKDRQVRRRRAGETAGYFQQ